VAGDVTGDGRADLVARMPDGTLWLNANGSSNTAPYSASSRIGVGWQGFSWFLAGDVTGGGRADVLASKPDGTLRLYINTGSNTAPYSGSSQRGTGWDGFSNVTLADVTGDGRADLLAAKSDGTLWLYTNGGSNSSPYSTAVRVGSGGRGFSWILAADVTGDRRADVVGVKADGTLWLYPNTGSNTAPCSGSTRIGSGWAPFTQIMVGDVTGDGRADLVASKADGTLWLYANGSSNTVPYSSGIRIGSGWQPFA
jgi:hypothetical protein